MTTSPLHKVHYAFSQPLLLGNLLRRYNRFLAEVALDDDETVVICHCPNSGSMLGCAEPGMKVALSHHEDNKRKTSYTWQLTNVGNTWVCINTTLANAVVLQAAQKKMPPCFSDMQNIKSEVKVGESCRLDFLVNRPIGKLFVEVKSVTLCYSNIAMFPDAITLRGQKHLYELMRLKADGNGALMIFLVQRQDASSFVPAFDIDPEYAGLLAQAEAAGVKILVWQSKVSPEGITLYRELPYSLRVT